MFDSIFVKRSMLPGDPPSWVGDVCEFQTKSLDCSMDEYEITDDGELVLVSSIVGEILVGAMELGKLPRVPINFHGTIDFYNSNMRGGAPNNKTGEYLYFTDKGDDVDEVNYLAKFTDGKLDSIVEVSRRKEKALAFSEWGKF